MKKIVYIPIEEPGKKLADSRKYPGAINGSLLSEETNKPCGSGAFYPAVYDTNAGMAKGIAIGAGSVAGGIGAGYLLYRGINALKNYLANKKSDIRRETRDGCISFDTNYPELNKEKSISETDFLHRELSPVALSETSHSNNRQDAEILGDARCATDEVC